MKPYEKGKGNPKQTQEDMVNRIYDAETQIDESYKPLMRGKDIEKYLSKWQGNRWIKYGECLAAPRNPDNFFSSSKIVLRQTGDCIIATLDDAQFVCMNNMHIINKLDEKYDLKYILALLNSKVIDFYYQFLNPEKGEALAEVKKENVEKLPIKDIDAEAQQPFISLVEKILQGKKDGLDTSGWERAIDELVYALYDLSPEEVAIVKGR
jgi:hypothetical protein